MEPALLIPSSVEDHKPMLSFPDPSWPCFGPSGGLLCSARPGGQPLSYISYLFLEGRSQLQAELGLLDNGTGLWLPKTFDPLRHLALYKHLSCLLT